MQKTSLENILSTFHIGRNFLLKVLLESAVEINDHAIKNHAKEQGWT